MGFGPLLVAAIAGLLLSLSVSALPSEQLKMAARREVQHAAPSNWVTVDASGHAHTVTPTVTTINGAATTISPPPDSLTQVGTYTLAPTSAAVTTSTGLSPVATASSSNGAGTFLACDRNVGVNAPFCQPKAGSQLNPGNTYYGEHSSSSEARKFLYPTDTPIVTWSLDWFSNTNTSVEVQGIYHDGTMTGFTSPLLPVTKGFYAWTIEDSILTGRASPLSTLNISLTLAYYKDNTSDSEDVPGPTVIVNSLLSDPGDNHGGGGTNVVAIAVPVVIVLVLLALTGLCVWSWRRHGTVPVLGALRRRSTTGGGGQGYGIRQSRSQRVGDGPGEAVVGSDKKSGGVGIPLTDRDSWSPSTSPAGPGGGQRNVFREEMERQQRER